MLQNRATHLERDMRQLIGARSVSSGSVASYLHALEAHEGIGAHGVTSDTRGGAYADAVGLARGRSHAIPPWSDQKPHEINNWVANETGDIFSGKKLAPMFVEVSGVFAEPRGHHYF